MDRLIGDASNIKNLLPWIKSEEDIINFMRKIPLDKSHLRNQLTLRYFLKTRDNQLNDYEKKIEDDARQIVIVMPSIPYREIKDKLTVLGNIKNRKEVVLRQLLNEKHDLDKVLKEINVATIKKRKTESCNDILESDSTENQTNINIKIRRVDGSLEVVSEISNQGKLSTSKNSTVTNYQIGEPTALHSVTSSSSTNHSSNSSPDSTVPSTTTGADDPCPELTAILNDLIETSPQPSTSESVIPTKTSIVPSGSSNIACTNAFNMIKSNEVMNIPSPAGENTTPPIISNITSNENKIEKKFNLIDFVKELSLASEYKIFQLCKRMGLNLNERPSEDKLNCLLNRLLDDEVVEIESAGTSDSDSETQEYNFADEFPGIIPPINKPLTVNPITKKFKLKEPVLTLTPTTPDSFSTPKGTIPPPVALIRPPRFNPANPKATTFPAMPRRYLDALQRFPEGNDEPPLLVRDLYEDSNNTLPAHSEKPENMVVDQDNKNLDQALNLIVGENNVTINENVESAIKLNDQVMAGPSNNAIQKKRVVDQNLVLRLIEMFPEACPVYIRSVCGGRQWTDLDDVVTVILSTPDYPRRPERVPSPPKEVDPEEQFEIIKELLPDADPTYLRIQCESFAGDEKGLKEFINRAMEMKEYPTMKEYLRKQQLSAQQKQYTTEFNIENFIQLFPEPEKTFTDPQRNIKIDSYSVHYLNTFFKNRYDKISVRIIQQVLIQNNFKVLNCDNIFLDIMKRKDTIKCRRKPLPLAENLENIPLLQELAYLSHRKDIKNYLLEKQKQEEQERLEAKKDGLMETCSCCYDEEVMPKDTFNCPNGCKFCRECIKKSCEVALGEGKTDFPCLAECSIEFTLQTLQSVLPPKMFSKLAQKKALAEIKAAGISELETCPFCDFATILNETDKIFRCLNPDCMKESCRKCKEPNHVPLKCEEVEKDQDVKARTYIENKMTEALLRKCWKCGTSFFKEEGCNKMTCSCGAQMCYICQQPVKDYTHFNGIGGDKYNLCPLYSDTNLINQQNVIGAAAAAKAEVDPSKLKVDPTVGITTHFKDRAKKLPREPHLEVIQQVNVVNGNNQQGIHYALNGLEERQRPLEMALVRRTRQGRQLAEGLLQ